MNTITKFKLADLVKKSKSSAKLPYFASHTVEEKNEKEYPEVSHLRAMKYTDLDANHTSVYSDTANIQKRKKY